MTLAQLLLLLDQHVTANRPPDDGAPSQGGGQRLGSATELAALAGMRIGG